MNQLLADRYYMATVHRMRAEVRLAVQAGTIPATVTSFSELHDHIDANELGGMCEDSDLEGLKGIDALNFHYPAYPGEEVEEGTITSAAMAALNDMQGDVDAWLKQDGINDGLETYFTKPCNPLAERTAEGFEVYFNTGNRMRCIYLPQLGGLGWFGEEMSATCAARLIETNARQMLVNLYELTGIAETSLDYRPEFRAALADARRTLDRINGKVL